MKSEYTPDAVYHLRRVASEQATTIARLRHELEVERAKRLRAEQHLAIERHDESAWARATAELATCCVSLDEVEAA